MVVVADTSPINYLVLIVQIDLLKKLLRDCVAQQESRHRLDFQGEPIWLVHHRGKTVTKPLALNRLGLPLSEKQIPQVVENLESGG